MTAAPADRTSLRFESVSKNYTSPTGSGSGIAAIRDVSFELRSGSSLGLIGPNGAGKSTALRLASLITGPTAGRIERAGATASVIELGAGVHPDLTGRENVDFLSSLLAASLGPDEIADAIEFSGLGAAIDEPVRSYSTGMLARLSFAVAVARPVDLLIVDEVLSVGDLEFQTRCRNRLGELRSMGTTLLLASHDMALVTDLSEQVLLLEAGRATLHGDAGAVVRRYLGQPDPSVPVGPLSVRMGESLLRPGEPLRVHFDISSVPPSSNLRLEYVVGMPPEITAVGQAPALVCAATVVPVTRSTYMALELSTRGLPRGHYDLRVTVENGDGSPVFASDHPFELAGPPGVFHLSVPASAQVVSGRDTSEDAEP